MVSFWNKYFWLMNIFLLLVLLGVAILEWLGWSYIYFQIAFSVLMAFYIARDLVKSFESKDLFESSFFRFSAFLMFLLFADSVLYLFVFSFQSYYIFILLLVTLIYVVSIHYYFKVQHHLSVNSIKAKWLDELIANVDKKKSSKKKGVKK